MVDQTVHVESRAISGPKQLETHTHTHNNAITEVR